MLKSSVALRRQLLTWIVGSIGSAALYAQDLEPRRWSHQPIGTTVVGLTYAYSESQLQFDPVLEISDADLRTNRLIATYGHWFPCFGKTARIDLILPYEDSKWTGQLSGAQASRERHGISDPWVRLSMNLIGAPPLKGEEFGKYRAQNQTSTIVGVGLGVMLPLGQYDDQKLLNLGQNRFIFRPQVGVLHTRGDWSYEMTGSVDVYTDNDEFFAGNQLTQDPTYALQGHIVRNFENRWWTSLSGGYVWGGTSQLNGVGKDDERSFVLSALSVGMPIGDTQALKLVLTRGDTKRLVGSDTTAAFLSWTLRV